MTGIIYRQTLYTLPDLSKILQKLNFGLKAKSLVLKIDTKFWALDGTGLSAIE
ncbi:MAG: hypothetical protein AAFR63_02965 [Cyanobacteria bacterium J06631_6]